MLFKPIFFLSERATVQLVVKFELFHDLWIIVKALSKKKNEKKTQQQKIINEAGIFERYVG